MQTLVPCFVWNGGCADGATWGSGGSGVTLCKVNKRIGGCIPVCQILMPLLELLHTWVPMTVSVRGHKSVVQDVSRLVNLTSLHARRR
jgi:hypothetical protein